MSKEITHVICTRSSRDGIFKKGNKYPLKDNIPQISMSSAGVSYTWNHPIRTNKGHLAQFEPYEDITTLLAYAKENYPKGTRYRPLYSDGRVMYSKDGIREVTADPRKVSDLPYEAISAGIGCIYGNGKWAEIVIEDYNLIKETPLEKCKRIFPIGSKVIDTFGKIGVITKIVVKSKGVYTNNGVTCLYDPIHKIYASVVNLPELAAEYPLTVEQLVPGRWYTTAQWGGIIKFEQLIYKQIHYSGYIVHGTEKIQIKNRWDHYYPGMMFKEVVPRLLRSFINAAEKFDPHFNKTEDYYKLNGTEIMGFSHADKVQEAIDMIAGLTQN